MATAPLQGTRQLELVVLGQGGSGERQGGGVKWLSGVMGQAATWRVAERVSSLSRVTEAATTSRRRARNTWTGVRKIRGQGAITWAEERQKQDNKD